MRFCCSAMLALLLWGGALPAQAPSKNAPDAAPPLPLAPLPGSPEYRIASRTAVTEPVYGSPATAEQHRQVEKYEQMQLAHGHTHNLPRPYLRKAVASAAPLQAAPKPAPFHLVVPANISAPIPLSSPETPASIALTQRAPRRSERATEDEALLEAARRAHAQRVSLPVADAVPSTAVQHGVPARRVSLGVRKTSTARRSRTDRRRRAVHDIDAG